jgi:hypothetical protein
VASARPDCQVIAIENSPVPWVIGWLRSRGIANCDWRWGSFWDAPLADADLAYAFLSPAPMARLWQKVCREMLTGSAFISNSFAVPDVLPSEIANADGRELYVYRLKPRGLPDSGSSN